MVESVVTGTDTILEDCVLELVRTVVVDGVTFTAVGMLITAATD